jgi:hypothetical protein
MSDQLDRRADLRSDVLVTSAYVAHRAGRPGRIGDRLLVEELERW